MLSATSIVTILAGFISTKVRAVLLGPEGLALSVLLQTILGLVVLVAGLGIGAGIIRTVAAALAAGDDETVRATRHAAWLLRLFVAVLALLLVLLFRSPISRVVLGGERYSGSLILIAVAVVFVLAHDLQSSLLNAYQRVEELVQLGIANAVLGSAGAVTVIALMGTAGIAPAILTSAVISCAVSAYLVRTRLHGPKQSANRTAVNLALRSLVRFGIPYTGSSLVGTGVQLGMPILVLHVLGAASVAYYQAAMIIAGTYLVFLINAMAQDYYPRLSAARGQPARLITMVNEQQRLVMMVTCPLIVLLLGVAPYLIPLAYTNAFRPAVAVLQWQLIGDLFKFSSWTLAFVVLARSGGRTYFLLELSGGLLYLSTSWLAAITWGIAGLGVSWLVAYAGYFVITWIIVRRDIGLTWSRQNKRMMAQAIITVCTVSLAALAGNEAIRLTVAGIGASVSIVTSLRALRDDLRGSERLVRLKAALVGLGVVRGRT